MAVAIATGNFSANVARTMLEAAIIAEKRE